MNGALKEIIEAHARSAIERALAQCPEYRTNGRVLKDYLAALGLPSSEEFLVEQLDALSQAGAIEMVAYEVEGGKQSKPALVVVRLLREPDRHVGRRW